MLLETYVRDCSSICRAPAVRPTVIAKLKRHFFTSIDGAAQKRKFFLLYGMGGIGKTQICLKFVEEMDDR